MSSRRRDERDAGTARIDYRRGVSETPDTYTVATDGACKGNPGPTGWAWVGEDGQWAAGAIPVGTNNIGEFLALVHVVALQHQRATNLPVYTDSVNAMKWLGAGKARTRLEPCQANQPVFDLLERAERWLANNRVNIPILKWDTQRWGEIPADFGRK